MRRDFTFKVAELVFTVVFEDDKDPLCDQLQQYIPFLMECQGEPDFKLNVLSPQSNNDSAEKNCSYNPIMGFEDGGIAFKIEKESLSGSYKISYRTDSVPYNNSIVTMDADFKNCILHTTGNSNSRLFGLNNALMMFFAFYGANKNILLFHASVIKHQGKGYLFLGKSGTGKSTHTSLWLKHIENAELLNDDNPVVGISKEGKLMVYGSPWSGKTPCYKNDKAEIGGFVRLSQAPYNKIERLSTLKAYAALLPTVSCMKWERHLSDGINRTLNSLITTVPVFFMECLPDKDAAQTTFETLTQQEQENDVG